MLDTKIRRSGGARRPPPPPPPPPPFPPRPPPPERLSRRGDLRRRESVLNDDPNLRALLPDGGRSLPPLESVIKAHGTLSRMPRTYLPFAITHLLLMEYGSERRTAQNDRKDAAASSSCRLVGRQRTPRMRRTTQDQQVEPSKSSWRRNGKQLDGIFQVLAKTKRRRLTHSSQVGQQTSASCATATTTTHSVLSLTCSITRGRFLS